MTGSQSIELLRQALRLPGPPITTARSDIDILFPRDKELILEAPLRFVHSHTIGPLYVRKSNPKVDCWVTDMSSTNWLTDYLKKRDFTINVVVNSDGIPCDHPGLEHDLEDLRNRVLRVPGDPKIRIQNDPVIILRAVRLLLVKFTLTPELRDAITSFKEFEPHQQAHLYSVSRGHLSKFYHLDYVMELHQLGLLKKLFGIDCPPEGVDETVVRKFKTIIQFNDVVAANPAGLFRISPEQAASMKPVARLSTGPSSAF